MRARRRFLFSPRWLALAGLALGCDARLPIGQLGDPVDGSPVHPAAGALDLVVVLDNSSSMRAFLPAITRALARDLPRILEASAVDFRVVLLSRYGAVGAAGLSENPVCVGAPLGANDCIDPEREPLVNHPPRFFHYSADIRSESLLCRLLEGWDRSDELPAGERAWTPLAPAGWSAYLRPGARKAILVISDDDVACVQDGTELHEDDYEGAARRFDRLLTGRSLAHFGTPAQRNYVWFSLVGIPARGPGNLPWPAESPLQTERCSEADDVGDTFQVLSRMTGGSRASICSPDQLEPLFVTIAATAREP